MLLAGELDVSLVVGCHRHVAQVNAVASFCRIMYVTAAQVSYGAASEYEWLTRRSPSRLSW